MPLGDRLREERNRLNLTQQAFADACGVNKRGQVRYEGDEQIPGGGYLAAAAELGIDVGYVLTGIRTGELQAQEAQLLASFRSASDEVKRVVLAALGAASQGPSQKARTVFEHAEIAHQISGDYRPSGHTTINVGGKPKKGG